MISADIMNIIVAIILGLKRAIEYMKMHNPLRDPTPVGAFGASIRVPSALDPQTTFLHTGLVTI